MIPERSRLHGLSSLSRQILLKLLLLGAIIVTAATVICYYLVYNQAKEKHLAHLKQYILERSRQDNKIFIDAHERLMFFRDEYLKLYLSDLDFTEKDFWDIYFVDEHGATRMKKAYFEEHVDDKLGRQWGMSSFIGNNQPIDNHDFQRRMLLANILVNRFGPAWHTIGTLHVSFPENAIMLFYPEEAWGLVAKPDLPMNELGTIKQTMQSVNPERKPVWTGLYYDETAHYWTITHEIPVDYEGRHLFNPSFDVHLEAIMNRLITEHPVGGYNFIIRENGDLVAHPDKLKEDQKWKGQLSLDEIDHPDITRMYYLIKDQVAQPYDPLYVLDDKVGENYLIIYHFAGPDWWFVLVYPRDLISREAHQTSRLVLLLGLTIFILYYVVISWVVTQNVRRPLHQLQQAIFWIGQGKYNEVAEHPDALPLKQKNEIGQLAGAFWEMSLQVRDINLNLENIVESRTQELEAANHKLEALSVTDGLTGLFNRRHFDQYLKEEWNRLQRMSLPLSLLMCDIDFFKKYNDTYGHLAGDKCIQAVTEVIRNHCKRPSDIAARYGGEEFAVILPQTDVEGALSVAKAIRKAIEESKIPHETSQVKRIVSISIGVSTVVPTQEDRPHILVALADDALYMSKQQGRDRVTVQIG